MRYNYIKNQSFCFCMNALGELLEDNPVKNVVDLIIDTCKRLGKNYKHLERFFLQNASQVSHSDSFLTLKKWKLEIWKDTMRDSQDQGAVCKNVYLILLEADSSFKKMAKKNGLGPVRLVNTGTIELKSNNYVLFYVFLMTS